MKVVFSRFYFDFFLSYPYSGLPVKKIIFFFFCCSKLIKQSKAKKKGMKHSKQPNNIKKSNARNKSWTKKTRARKTTKKKISCTGAALRQLVKTASIMDWLHIETHSSSAMWSEQTGDGAYVSRAVACVLCSTHKLITVKKLHKINATNPPATNNNEKLLQKMLRWLFARKISVVELCKND